LIAEALRTVPTPMMAPVIVWVVLAGMPSAEVKNNAQAPAVSAQNPQIY